MGTKIISRPLKSKDQTGQEMHRLINDYYTDVDSAMIENGGNNIPLSRLPIDQAFDTVKNIPYRRDNKPMEVVARPGISLRNADAGLDCKKKAIILSSYLKRRGIPYRLIASSRRKDGRVHHVYPQMKFGNGYYNLDATLPNYEPLQEKTGITKKEVLDNGGNGVELSGFDASFLTNLFKGAGILAEPIAQVFGVEKSKSQQELDLLKSKQEQDTKNKQLLLMVGLPVAAVILTVILTDNKRQAKK